ncbi:restriction endonuclease subunit S [Pseudoalteromonas sp. ESRF-bin5]|uniref:restriction endonuclease subunit S n=1 Tax=Pseudoalteromonas sp. ESRF-bin5 TaxID=2014532 RepID=UPI00257BC713|nr:restriction endonuclease subunit S [Pseudoalteromonas sp. ESRF-bin5]
MSKLATRKKLGELCSVVTKGTTPTSLGMKFEDEGVPFLRIQNLSGSSVHLKDILYISEDTHNALNRSKIMPGDFLITIAGTIGRVAIVPDDFPEANCNQAVAILRFDKSKLLPRYLLHWLTTNDALRQISGKKVTATISNLSLGQIKELEIPLPPLDEQKRIAAILDKADAIRRKRQQAIQLADDFLRSVFLDMFGDPVTNPKGFPMGTIRDFVETANYGSSGKASETEGEYPMLRMGNITYEGGWDFTNLKYIDLSEKDKPKYLTQKGDLLFNRTNSKELVGKTAVFEEEKPMAIAGYLIRVRTNELGNNYYLSGYLNSAHGKKTLVGMCKSIVGMANINAQELQNIKVLLPPIELQNEFEMIVKITKQKVKSFNRSSELLNDNFNSLSQKAFAGEL